MVLSSPCRLRVQSKPSACLPNPAKMVANDPTLPELTRVTSPCRGEDHPARPQTRKDATQDGGAQMHWHLRLRKVAAGLPRRAGRNSGRLPDRKTKFACGLFDSTSVGCDSFYPIVKERRDELIRVKDRKVCRPFPNPHVLHGKLELASDRNDHAALGRTVQLCQDDSCTPGRF